MSRNVKIKIHGITVLSLVLYGRATWSLKLGEECRLRVFENRVLRTILGPGEWTRLHNEELYAL
jgi:hypothetical protein